VFVFSLHGTGQHAPHGFCVVNRAGSHPGAGSSVRAEDLHRWMIAALGLGDPATSRNLEDR
jgi:hypothetical protein